MSKKALVVDESDNVANLVGPGEAGASVSCDVAEGKIHEKITLAEEIPPNHKFARRAIQPGENIVKYGHVIGVASKPIEPGQHVHAHNVESNRGRGDQS